MPSILRDVMELEIGQRYVSVTGDPFGSSPYIQAETFLFLRPLETQHGWFEIYRETTCTVGILRFSSTENVDTHLDNGHRIFDEHDLPMIQKFVDDQDIFGYRRWINADPIPEAELDASITPDMLNDLEEALEAALREWDLDENE